MLVLWDQISSAHTATSLMSHAQLSITHSSQINLFFFFFLTNFLHSCKENCDLSAESPWVRVYEPALSETSIYWSSLISWGHNIGAQRSIREVHPWMGWNEHLNKSPPPKKKARLAPHSSQNGREGGRWEVGDFAGQICWSWWFWWVWWVRVTWSFLLLLKRCNNARNVHLDMVAEESWFDCLVAF